VRRIVVVAIALVCVAVLAATVVHRPSAPVLTRVQRVLRDDHRFASGPKAGESLAAASEWLLDDGRACEADRGQDDPRCAARFTAAAFTSVAAVSVASCTAPGVYRTRTALLDYVGALVSFDHRHLGTVRVPSPPKVEGC